MNPTAQPRRPVNIAAHYRKRMQAAPAHAIGAGNRSAAMAMPAAGCSERQKMRSIPPAAAAAALASALLAVPAGAQQAPSVAAPAPGQIAPATALSGARPQPFATLVFEPAAMMIAACDANFDAMVTRAELHACLKRGFTSAAGAAADIGYIGYGDWAKTWLGDANALPSPYSVDTDDDNRITLAELTAEFDRFFDRYDADRNGSVTRAELLTLRTAPSTPPGKKNKR